MAGWFDKLLGDLLGGPRKVDKAVPSTSIPMFADWLPYRSFDPKTGLYYNSASRGFILEVSSEERTSELQSLMRISYAVFCLKKKRTRHCLPNLSTRTTMRHAPVNEASTSNQRQ